MSFNNFKSELMLSLFPKSTRSSSSIKSQPEKPSLDLSSASNFGKEAKKNGWANHVAVRSTLGGA